MGLISGPNCSSQNEVSPLMYSDDGTSAKGARDRFHEPHLPDLQIQRHQCDSTLINNLIPVLSKKIEDNLHTGLLLIHPQVLVTPGCHRLQ